MTRQASTLEGVMETLRKIAKFKNLPPGWHYGQGVPPSRETIQLANKLLIESLLKGFTQTDAFPGASGEIQVTLYHGNFYMEFTIEPSGVVTTVLEENGNEIDYTENLSFENALSKLKEYNDRIWASLDLFTTNILTAARESSRVLPSRTQATEQASQSLTENVRYREVRPSVGTSIDSIQRWLASLRSSGTFQPECLHPTG